MILETIKIHDNFQFEIKQSYNLSLDRKAANSYFVQTYFFLPANLNINRETYSREDFYKETENLSTGCLTNAYNPCRHKPYDGAG